MSNLPDPVGKNSCSLAGCTELKCSWVSRLAPKRAGHARVLIVDDQRLVRTGFRMILDVEPDIEVVGEAGNGVHAIAQAHELHPDVVLMDIRMPELDGIGTHLVIGETTVRPTSLGYS